MNESEALLAAKVSYDSARDWRAIVHMRVVGMHVVPRAGRRRWACLRASLTLPNNQAYLLKTSTKTGISVYDHLSNVLEHLLDERPDNAVDILEDVSSQVKREKFESKASTIHDRPEIEARVALAKKQNELFAREETDAPPEDEEKPAVPDIVSIASRFEEGGVGIGKYDALRINIALKKLVTKHPIVNTRFWGKIFGLEKDYYVAEAQYKDGEAPKAPEKEEEEAVDPVAAEEPEEGVVVEAPPPKSQFKPPPPVPIEEQGNGANKKVYFVTNESKSGISCTCH